jgi:hypothetical protein
MATCKSCGQALVLELDPDDFDEATSSVVGGSPTVVPDDLELPCSCHFHWYVVLLARHCFTEEQNAPR